jgi:hypothetical protein
LFDMFACIYFLWVSLIILSLIGIIVSSDILYINAIY